jgi:hypothetical protein
MIAMLAWLILIIAPHWKYTERIVQLGVIPLLLAIIYTYLIAFNIGSSEGGFDSLESVGKLFQNPYLLLAGWIHYLAFDLWVGSWEVGDARKNKIPHFLIIPCLVFTFFFGPVGLLMYILVRWFKTKRLVVHDNF